LPIGLATSAGDFSSIRRFPNQDQKNIAPWSSFDGGGQTLRGAEGARPPRRRRREFLRICGGVNDSFGCERAAREEEMRELLARSPYSINRDNPSASRAPAISRSRATTKNAA
jgi:hypothetical protein